MARQRDEPGEQPQPSLTDLIQRPPRSERRALVAQRRRQLVEYRAELDQRMQRGEIGRATRRRYLAAYRRQFLPEGPAIRWFRRLMLGIVLPLVGLSMLIVGAVEIGPAYSAAHGHGTPGYFTAVRADTCTQQSACSWVGTFTSENGTDIRRNVSLDGTWTGVSAATEIPALDTGDVFGVVFPRTGSRHWHEDALWLALGVMITAICLCLMWLPWLGVTRWSPRRGPARRHSRGT